MDTHNQDGDINMNLKARYYPSSILPLCRSFGTSIIFLNTCLDNSCVVSIWRHLPFSISNWHETSNWHAYSKFTCQRTRPHPTCQRTGLFNAPDLSAHLTAPDLSTHLTATDLSKHPTASDLSTHPTCQRTHRRRLFEFSHFHKKA